MNKPSNPNAQLERPEPTLGDIDAQVKDLLLTNPDQTLLEKKITAIALTPAHYIFDDRQRLVAKVSMFYTGPSTQLTTRGLTYSKPPDEDGYRKEFKYSWDPMDIYSEQTQVVDISYINDASGDKFATKTNGFGWLDLAAMQEAVDGYMEAY